MSLHWLWRLHRGKLLGAAAGFVIALLIMWVGWKWAILILAFMVAGALIGAWLIDSQAGVNLTDE